MTKTQFTLDDVGARLSERALLHFCLHLPVTSELWRSMNPNKIDESVWQDESMLPQLMATLIDEVRAFQWMFAQSRSKRSIKNKYPEQIDRPGVKSRTKKYGAEPIPASEFKEWYGGEN